MDDSVVEGSVVDNGVVVVGKIVVVGAAVVRSGQVTIQAAPTSQRLVMELNTSPCGHVKTAMVGGVQKKNLVQSVGSGTCWPS